MPLNRDRATAPESGENWFVVQLKPNGLGLAQRNLERQGFAHFCPTRLETLRRAQKTVVAPKPLFAGYLFVQFNAADPNWRAINGTRGIARLLLNDTTHPKPLPAPFVAGLLARCDGSDMLKDHDDLATGDQVRVISGPFAEIVSTVEDLDANQRIRVLIDLMGRKVRLQVPRGAVEKLDTQR
ncbi:transcription termination/antitermination protein NusG [Tateyamaria pelophila]|uniref:transcription termination/antitermination protein NusG n=1 Tax=Tateyamaria pelophila TaxID=328415 RepID=UPI001CBCA067|nr:transcriptional activator RfaH [Tateyamaria pelophila]